MTPLPRDPRHTPGPKQMTLHAPRPVLLVELHQRLQLPQVMRVAKRMLHTRHRPIALPVVVHRYPGHPRRHCPTPLAYPIGRQQEPAPDPIRGCAHHMKPTRATADPKPGLVQMLHTRLAGRQLLYVRGRVPQTPRSPTAHRRQCRRRHTHPEQHRHHLRQPPLRQELRMTQPDRRTGKSSGHTAPGPTHRPGTPPASPHRNARSDAHDPDAP